MVVQYNFSSDTITDGTLAAFYVRRRLVNLCQKYEQEVENRCTENTHQGNLLDIYCQVDSIRGEIFDHY